MKRQHERMHFWERWKPWEKQLEMQQIERGEGVWQGRNVSSDSVIDCGANMDKGISTGGSNLWSVWNCVPKTPYLKVVGIQEKIDSEDPHVVLWAQPLHLATPGLASGESRILKRAWWELARRPRKWGVLGTIFHHMHLTATILWPFCSWIYQNQPLRFRLLWLPQ